MSFFSDSTVAEFFTHHEGNTTSKSDSQPSRAETRRLGQADEAVGMTTSAGCRIEFETTHTPTSFVNAVSSASRFIWRRGSHLMCFVLPCEMTSKARGCCLSAWVT